MLEQLGKQAKEASIILGKAGIEDKNEVLREAAKCCLLYTSDAADDSLV